jgi:hypothetical protein
MEGAAIALFHWIVPEDARTILPTRLLCQLIAGLILVFLGLGLGWLARKILGRVKLRYGLAFDPEMNPVCFVDYAPLSALPEKGGWAMRCPVCGNHYASHEDGKELPVAKAIQLAKQDNAMHG